MSAEKPREYACRVSENQPGTDVGSCFLIGTENDIFKDKLHMVLKEDYDTLTAERDALKKNMKLVTEEKEAFEKYCDDLIKKLEPSKNTFESALGEIEHLKQCELVLGKQGIRDSGLRIENEKLKADLLVIIFLAPTVVSFCLQPLNQLTSRSNGFLLRIYLTAKLILVLLY